MRTPWSNHDGGTRLRGRCESRDRRQQLTGSSFAASNHRKFQGKGGAYVWNAQHGNLSSMLLHNVFAHGQTQPGPFRAARKARLKDPPQITGSDAATLVTELHADVGLIRLLQGNRQLRRRLHSAKSVDRQVEEHLLELVGVTINRAVAGLRIKNKFNTVLLSNRSQKTNRRFHQIGQLQRKKRHMRLGIELQYVVDRSGEQP